MYFEDNSSAVPKTTNIKAYRKAKLKILSRDFKVKLTEEELAHAETLTTEVQIDQFCMGILDKRWGVRQMMILIILAPILLSTIIVAIIMFFTDDSCLPHKRKMERMLGTIRSYQRRNDLSCVEINYKGKHFKVGVDYDEPYYLNYSNYEVYINGKLVKTFHILHHLYSKSRLEQHHGDMRHYEEHEIIEAAYKFVEKADNESFNEKWDKSSYFN